MQCFCGNILSVNARNGVFRYLVDHNGIVESMGNQLPEQYRNMQAAVDFLAGRGIGCVHTVSGVGFVGNLDISMEKILPGAGGILSHGSAPWWGRSRR